MVKIHPAHRRAANRTFVISLEGYWQSLRNQWLFRLFADLKSGLSGRNVIPLGITASMAEALNWRAEPFKAEGLSGRLDFD
jgi:hypothetical protein